jgi:flavin-dependent dehydrogenase
MTLPARVVIAADGRASRLASALRLSRFAASPRRWAFGAYFQSVNGHSARGEMHIRRDGYIGVAPLPCGLTNVCVVRELGPPGRSDAAAAIRRAIDDDSDVAAPRWTPNPIAAAIAADPLLRDRFSTAQQVSPITTLGPLAVDSRRAGCPGLLLAGDSAGFIDPMTGDGLRFALRGGMLAAEAALQELATGRPAWQSLHAARAREFSRKWRINRVLRRLIGSPAGVNAAASIAARWDMPVRYLIGIAGDVDVARHAER